MLVNLKDVIIPAKKGKYAVGLFNAVNMELFSSVNKATLEQST